MPVEQKTEKQVQGVAKTQKRRLSKGAGSCEGKCDQRTEQTGSQLSALK